MNYYFFDILPLPGSPGLFPDGMKVMRDTMIKDFM
jgi:hypothetical protein